MLWFLMQVRDLRGCRGVYVSYSVYICVYRRLALAKSLYAMEHGDHTFTGQQQVSLPAANKTARRDLEPFSTTPRHEAPCIGRDGGLAADNQCPPRRELLDWAICAAAGIASEGYSGLANGRLKASTVQYSAPLGLVVDRKSFVGR